MNSPDPFGDSPPRIVSKSISAVSSSSSSDSEELTAEKIGAMLCSERMRLGTDLQEIASLLRIRYRYLVAIEDGRFEDLPGGTYSIGFVRAYADFLGLDGNAFANWVGNDKGSRSILTKYDFSLPSSDNDLPTGAVLLISILLGVFIYITWFSFIYSENKSVVMINEIPERFQVLIDSQIVNVTLSSFQGINNNSIKDVYEESSNSLMVQESQEGTDIVLNSQSSELDSGNNLDIISDPVPQNDEADKTVSSVGSVVLETEAEDFNPINQSSSPTISRLVVNEDELDPILKKNQNINLDSQSDSIEKNKVDDTSDSDSSSLNEVEKVVSNKNENQDNVGEDIKNELEQSASLIDESEVKNDSEIVEERSENSSSIPQKEMNFEIKIPDIKKENNSEKIVKIELRAKSDSWIQVRSGDKLLVTRLLRSGELYEIPDEQELTLMTGNSDGVEILVDGKLLEQREEE